MKTLVLSAMFAAFFLFAAVFYPMGRRADEKKRRLEQVADKGKDFLSEELHQPLSQRFLLPMLRKVTAAFSVFNIFRGRDAKADEKLAGQLRMAGMGMSCAEFNTAKGILQLALVGAAVFAAFRFAAPDLMTRLMICAIGMLLALLIPNYYLKNKIKTRQQRIIADLPGVMDLLLVSVEAGLGFDNAILQLYEKEKTELTKELYKPVRDVQMGLPRRQALKDMGERNGVAELKVLATSLIQAEQLGVSIKNVLAAQADQLRTAHKQRIEAKAMKAPVKMMIPTVAFIFPVMFIILLAPSLMKFLEVF